MNILDGWEVSHFKGDILRHVSCSIPFLYNLTEPKNKQIDMVHEISRLQIVKYPFFRNLISHFDLLISPHPNIAQTFFCTQGEAMDPTFKIKYISSRFVFNLTEILIIKHTHFFLRHPVVKLECGNSHCQHSISTEGFILFPRLITQ